MKNKPMVGEVVHYVSGARGLCQAAIVTGAWGRNAAHMRVFNDCGWRKPKHKSEVSYAKKRLRRTWHRLEDCHPKEKRKKQHPHAVYVPEIADAIEPPEPPQELTAEEHINLTEYINQYGIFAAKDPEDGIIYITHATIQGKAHALNERELYDIVCDIVEKSEHV